MKLDREKYLLEPEVRRLLDAVRTRVRMSSGRGKVGAPHPHMARDYALLATSSLSGVREIELTSFRVADLRGVIGDTRDERPARVRVRRAKKRDPRTGDPVYEEVALPETARRALVEYLGKLPPEEKQPWSRVFPITTKQAQRLFKYYAKRAGLDPSYSMHALRHSRGVELYAKHRDLKLVQQALGHAKLETTGVYLHTVELDAKLAGTDLTPKEEPDEQRTSEVDRRSVDA